MGARVPSNVASALSVYLCIYTYRSSRMTSSRSTDSVRSWHAQLEVRELTCISRGSPPELIAVCLLIFHDPALDQNRPFAHGVLLRQVRRPAMEASNSVSLCICTTSFSTAFARQMMRAAHVAAAAASGSLEAGNHMRSRTGFGMPFSNRLFAGAGWTINAVY
jgi:hypothetical protein